MTTSEPLRRFQLEAFARGGSKQRYLSVAQSP